MKKVLIVAITALILIPVISLAAFTLDNNDENLTTVQKGSGITEADVGSVAGTGIKGAIGLVGIFFFILMVYGGFLWMTARGNDEQVTKAQDLIKDAIIGMIVVVMAYGITVAVGKFVG